MMAPAPADTVRWAGSTEMPWGWAEGHEKYAFFSIYYRDRSVYHRVAAAKTGIWQGDRAGRQRGRVAERDDRWQGARHEVSLIWVLLHSADCDTCLVLQLPQLPPSRRYPTAVCDPTPTAYALPFQLQMIATVHNLPYTVLSSTCL